MRVQVEWDFSQTDLEGEDYQVAVEMASLPTVILVPLDVAYEDDEGVTDWISEEFGFSIIDWWEVTS